MGIVIPRPAMRRREERVIKARLSYYDRRRSELLAQGSTNYDADKVAYAEALRIKCDRSGNIISNQ